MLKGYDDWLFSQAEDYLDNGEEHDEDNEDCECHDCCLARKEAYLEAQGEYQYELDREGR